MSERKVLNKYFPPDFDPSKVPRRKIDREAQQKVRLMAPFSMRCETCGEYIYKGKKFNARKELVPNEKYFNIKIFRFYIRCPRCAAEITFKTDPANADYVADKGAVRNFEPWREERIINEGLAELVEEEEENPLKKLENRTLESKREMDILDALDELRTRNARNERIDPDSVLERLEQRQAGKSSKTREELEAEEDDRIAKMVFRGSEGERVRRIMDLDLALEVDGEEEDGPEGNEEGVDDVGASSNTTNQRKIRIPGFEDDEEEEVLPHLRLAKEIGVNVSSLKSSNSSNSASSSNATRKNNDLDGIIVRKRPNQAESDFGIRKKVATGVSVGATLSTAASKPPKAPTAVSSTSNALGLLGAYGDSDEDSDA